MVSRRNVLKTSAIGLTAGVAGCTGNGGGNGNGGNGNGNGNGGNGGGNGNGNGGNGNGDDASGSGSDVNVGMIYALGGTGDQSFSDAANRGINEAVDEFGISFQDAGPQDSGDFGSYQQQFARSSDPNYDLIICLGFEHVSDLEENAAQYSDQKWALLDDSIDAPNVESWVYAEEQGAYMAGEAAAKLSQQEFSAGGAETDPENKTLGFIGGVEVPVVQAFEAGFRAGAQSVDEEFEVLSSYVGGFANPGAVEEAAISMIDNGADVLLHGAGAGGSGMFQACQNRGRFAFGADSRQSETASEFADVILGSIIKGVDASVVRAVERVVEGEFEGGRTLELGAGEGGFDLPWGVEIGDEIPQEIKDEAAATKEAIANGEIDVSAQP
jgi:basic membrane protein A